MKKHDTLDLMDLEPVDQLDEEELVIHKELITGNTISVDSTETRARYAKIFKESNKRSKAINLRLQENDYIGIKAKAMELGMPYQSLINSIIHRFLTGDLHSDVKGI